MNFSTVSRILILTLLFYIQSEATQVENVDFDVQQFESHHTKDFYATDNGTEKVIVRRGADFTFNVQLDENSEDVMIEVQLSFKTNQDQMDIKLPSSENGWSLEQTPSGKDINVVVHIPGNAPVGIWRMELVVKSGSGSTLQSYEVPNEIVVLFNAWSSEDAAFFRETHKLSEYVLSETGYVYFYNWRAWTYRPWIFGQFQTHVLDAILFVLDKSQLSAADRGNIVKVARTLTHLMNDGGKGHEGVLRGRWKEPYNGGLNGYPTTNPSAWTGSADIFRQYYSRGGVAVGYGQCWVFAGILTTAYRALGIASRPVGNFASAHDEGEDLTANTYLDKNGNVNLRRSDTLWNFHEWTEAWFKREDLGMSEGEWQELDATPQAVNEDKLQVGPASISHIYNSNMKSKYETLYLYSEVNADEVVRDHRNKIIQIDRKKVGLAVVTKAFGSDNAEDITHHFKPKEGTKEERDSYIRAAQSLGITPESLKPENAGRKLSDKISLSLSCPDTIHIGQPIRVQILVRNHKVKLQHLSLSVKASSIYYNGKLKDEIKNETATFSLKGLEKKKVVFTIDTNEYIGLLANQRTIFIDAAVMVGDEIYHVVERFTLHAPKLEIIAPKTVERNSKFNVDVIFQNPLKQTLKNCILVVEAKGFARKIFNVSDVPALAKSKTTLQLSTSRVASETFVIHLYTQTLKVSVGFTKIQVKGKLRHAFKSFKQRKNIRRARSLSTSSRMSNVTADMFDCCDYIYF